ncbi:MAG TPA: hypothetical protein VEZ41_15700, partial [Allosphingosinicella sp.]|nr:hypothetical protein [Allosphingosinicella sp.]
RRVGLTAQAISEKFSEKFGGQHARRVSELVRAGFGDNPDRLNRLVAIRRVRRQCLLECRKRITQDLKGVIRG